MSFYMVVRRYAPFKMFSGFEGDNRSGPSTSATATARCASMVKFDRGKILAFSGGSSGTHYTWMGQGVSDFLGTWWSVGTTELRNRVEQVHQVSFLLEGEGSNPMVPGAPAISTFVDARIRFTDSDMTVGAVVSGDNFPNGEIFMCDDAGHRALLFDFRTAGGGTTGPATRLWGSHDDQLLGRFTQVFQTRGNAMTTNGAGCPITQGT